MKRSELNSILKESVAFIESMHFALPPFAFWKVEQWQEKDDRYRGMKDTMLGWDITDFGSGDFSKVGLLMFTIRNGALNDPRYPKPYAEKLLITDENQVTPFHYHNHKMEDIINRGGGNLLVKVYNSTEDDQLDEINPVTIYKDGFCDVVPAGSIIRLTRGESITLDASRGYVLVAHAGAILGFANNLGNRANNLYPKPQRILSTHLPDTSPTILSIA